jgi:putative FmdB family regulatory protein
MDQKITEEAVRKCPHCGEDKARRLISSNNFILKGSGWFKDGY